MRRRVVTSVVIQKKDCMDVDEHMAELFSFLSHQVTLLQRAANETNGHNVLCSLTQIGRFSQEGLHETVGAYS